MLKCLAATALGAAALLIAVPVALACDEEAGAPTSADASKPAPKTLEVEQLAALMETSAKDKVPLFIFDANSDGIRKDKGMIPTAIKLPSSSDYDLALLPKDKADATVFYCSNSKCGASKAAAARALQAGYTNVHVLPAGIVGWAKAGKPVAKLPQA